MNEAKQSHWIFLHRPHWKPLSGFAIWFTVLLLISGASLSSPLQICVVFLTALGYVLIFDSVRLLIAYSSSRVGSRAAIALTGVGLALLLGFLITRWGEAVTAPRFIVASIRFAVVLGISAACATALGAACATALARPRPPNDRKA